MTDATQEVYIFDENSEEQHKEESQHDNHHEATSPTRLKPVRTQIRSARNKITEPEPNISDPKQKNDTTENTLTPQIFEFNEEYIPKELPGEDTPDRPYHQSELLPTHSPEHGPKSSPESSESPESPVMRMKLSENEDIPVVRLSPEDKEDDRPPRNLKVMIPEKRPQLPERPPTREPDKQPERKKVEVQPRNRRRMQPEEYDRGNRQGEQEQEQQEEEDGDLSSVDEQEYLDQFPIPSASVERDHIGNLFKVRQVPSTTNVEQHAVISKQFMMEPLMQGTSLTCWVVKQKTGVLKTGSTYIVYTKNEKKLVMAAKKLSAKTTSQYLISLSADNITTRDANYFACCRSNFFGTEWNIYDSGEQPSKATNPEAVRKHLAHIEYEFNLFGMNGPRKMDVVIPRLTKSNKASVVRSVDGENQLKLLIDESPQKIMRLHNKAPTFDEKQKVFILDFKGKVKEASVKNFILHDNYTKRDCMVFGKHTQQRYLMEFSYPLSPVQAFGICLTSLDRKLMVE